MRILKIILSISILTFFLAALFFKKEAIACESIQLTNFSEIAPNLFTDNSLTKQQNLQLKKSIQQAFERVNNVYGAALSSPRIIATTNVEYAKVGLNLTGMQSSGFFRECIFLGPKGLNADVIAHELVHAEVRYRLDKFTEFMELPAWFIEGTAIRVDYRPPFLLENIDLNTAEVEKIQDIFYLSDFPTTSIKSYQATRVAIQTFNPKNLYQGLERLNNGEKFETVFKVGSE